MDLQREGGAGPVTPPQYTKHDTNTNTRNNLSEIKHMKSIILWKELKKEVAEMVISNLYCQIENVVQTDFWQ